MHLAATFLALTTLWLVTPAQTPTSVTGLPFEIGYNACNPQLPPTPIQASSWGLNSSNNGVRDYGELMVDCGGMGNAPCPIPPSIVTAVIRTSTADPEDWIWNSDPYTVHIQRGDLYAGGIFTGVQFELRWAVAADGTPQSDVGVVLDRPTRDGNENTITDPDGLQLTNRAWMAYGAIVATASDSVGYHPYAYSMQQGELLAAYLRSLGRTKIIRSGGSYGGAVTAMSGLARSAVFDGVAWSGAPLSLRDFEAFKAFAGIRLRAGGQPPWYDRRYQGMDGMSTALGQHNLTVDSLDIGNHPEFFQVPVVAVLGECDFVGVPPVPLNGDDDFYDWSPPNSPHVQIRFVEDAGHGDQRVANHANWTIQTLLDLIDDNAANIATGPVALPPQRTTRYDDFLLSQRLVDPAPTYSYRLTCEWDKVAALGSEIGAELDTAATYGQALYTVGLEGVLTRTLWNGNSLVEDWKSSAGLDPGSLWVGTTGGVETVLVGSARGIQAFNASDGQERWSRLANAPSAGNPGPYDVRAITVGEFLTSSPGDEVLSVFADEYLLIQSADTGQELARHRIGIVGRIEITSPNIFWASLGRGHLAKFEFLESQGPQPASLTATVISEALHFQPRDFHRITQVSTGTHLVTAGTTYDQDQSVRICMVDVCDGSIDWQYALGNGKTIDHLHQVSPSEIVYGFQNAVWRLDVSSPGNTPTRILTDGENFCVGNLRGTGATSDLIQFKLDGSVDLVDLASETVVGSIAGVHPRSAVCIYENPSQANRLEVSALLPSQGSTWKVETYVASTGALDDTAYIPKLSNTHKLPKRLVRTGADASLASSFEYFDRDGIVLPSTLSGLLDDMRVSRRAGRLFLSKSRLEEHYYLMSSTDASNGQALEEALVTDEALHEAPATWSRSEVMEAPIRGPEYPAIDDAAVELVELGPTNTPFIAYATQGGVVGVVPASASQWFMHCGLTEDIDGCDKRIELPCQGISAMTAANVDADPENELIVGAWIPEPESQGVRNSLFILDYAVDPNGGSDPVLTVKESLPAGRVASILVADIIHNVPGEEIIITDHNGLITILDHARSTTALYVGNEGWIAPGDNRSMFAIPATATTPGYLIYSHSGGLTCRKVELAP